jgi:hypothetical protein
MPSLSRLSTLFIRSSFGVSPFIHLFSRFFSSDSSFSLMSRRRPRSVADSAEEFSPTVKLEDNCSTSHNAAPSSTLSTPVKISSSSVQSTPKSNRSPFPKIAELNLPPPTPSSASSANTAKSSKSAAKRHIKLEFESSAASDSRPTVPVSEPPHWRAVYDEIVGMRDQLNAPVDSMVKNNQQHENISFRRLLCIIWFSDLTLYSF